MIQGFASVGPHPWRRIAQPIRESIATGKLQPGDPMPRQRDLAEVTGYARDTVARAYRELSAEGLISKQHNGFVVAARGVCDTSHALEVD